MDKTVEEAADRDAFWTILSCMKYFRQRDIAQAQASSCTCGSREGTMQVKYRAVELICARCAAGLRVPAAAADDIDNICCKQTLLIRGKKE